MERREEIPINITSKINMVEEVTLQEEDLTKEVEVEEEEEEEKLSFCATNTTSWGINNLNVQGRKM